MGLSNGAKVTAAVPSGASTGETLMFNRCINDE